MDDAAIRAFYFYRISFWDVRRTVQTGHPNGLSRRAVLAAVPDEQVRDFSRVYQDLPNNPSGQRGYLFTVHTPTEELSVVTSLHLVPQTKYL